MTKFLKPSPGNPEYYEMAAEAGQMALKDAGLDYKEIEQVYAGYCHGDSTCGQRSVYEIGLTGVPIINVNNNCATGSTALYLAKQAIRGGQCECVLAMGFEKMEPGSLGSKFEDRENPVEKHFLSMAEIAGAGAAPPMPQMFGNAAKEHMKKYGTTPQHLAKIAYKNHKHSVHNANSQFRDEYSLDDILKSKKVFGPLTKLQCCPTSDGAAAAVLCSEAFVRKNKLEGSAVEVIGMQMRTDMPSVFSSKSCMELVGTSMSKAAAASCYAEAGIGPESVQVVELHDCFSANELITYEALGLCAEGKAGELVDSGNNTYGGKYVVNPSGGLISKGHPLGATGIAQCAELCWQLRGMAGQRQVPSAKVGLQHNLGLGGAVVVGMYRVPEWTGADSVARSRL